MFLNKMLNFLNFCYISLNRYCAYCVPCVTVSVFQPTLRCTILDSRFLLLLCDLGRQASPLQQELGSGISRITRNENFLSQQFSNFFWKLLLFMASPLQHESVRVRQCSKKDVRCLIESKKDRT